MKLLPIVTTLTFFAFSLGASERPVVEFNYQKRVSKPLKEILDAKIRTLETNEYDMYTFDDGVYMVDWLPDYVIKKSSSAWSRLAGAQHVTRAIAQLEKKQMFVVPKKYKYTSPSGQRYVIAQKLKDSSDDINLSDVQNIVQLAVYSGWHDAHRDNLFKSPDGAIAIIDTEKEQFFSDKRNDEYAVMSRMLKLDGKGYTKDAQTYLITKNLEHIHSQSSYYGITREK